MSFPKLCGIKFNIVKNFKFYLLNLTLTRKHALH